MAAQRRRHVGEMPVVEIVEARFRLEHAQHFPARVVEQHHDRIEAVAAAVAELPAGHLERAVADQDQRAAAGRGRHADAGRHAEAHAGVVAGRSERGVLDLHGGEQAITDVGGHRHRAVTVEQVVDGRGDVGRCDRLVVVLQPARIARLRASEPARGRRRAGAPASRVPRSDRRAAHRDRRDGRPATSRSKARIVRRGSSRRCESAKLVSERITPSSRSASASSTSWVMAGSPAAPR